MARINVILEQGNADEITIFCENEDYNISADLKARPFANTDENTGANQPIIVNTYQFLERFTVSGYIASVDKDKLRRMALGRFKFKYKSVDGTNWDGVTTEQITPSTTRIRNTLIMEKLSIKTDAREEQDELKVTITAIVGDSIT